MLEGQLSLFVSFGVGAIPRRRTGWIGRSRQPDRYRLDGRVAWSGPELDPRDANSWLVYLTGNIPVGSYESQRSANVGIGHGAIDAGGGYTYSSRASGLSLSAGVGFTYNFENSAPTTGTGSTPTWVGAQCNLYPPAGELALRAMSITN